MKIFKLFLLFTLGLVLCIGIGKAQHNANPERSIRIELGKLREYSVEYDKYSKTSSSKFVKEKEKYTKLYKDQLNKIKRGSERHIYIQFLDKATGVDSLKYKNEKGYSYISPENPLLVPRISKMPTLLEYYKVVKYSLFEMDKDELLPPKDVPFLRFKEW